MTDAFERVLRGKLAKQLENETNWLAIGFAKDFAEYRNRCGRIEALTLAVSLCEEAHNELHGNPQKDAT